MRAVTELSATADKSGGNIIWGTISVTSQHNDNNNHGRDAPDTTIDAQYGHDGPPRSDRRGGVERAPSQRQ